MSCTFFHLTPKETLKDCISTLLQKKHSKSAFPPYSKRNSKSAVPQNVSSVFHVPPQFWFLFLQKCSDCVQCLVFCTKMNGPTSHSWKEHASMSMIVYTFPWMINNSVLNARDFINESHKAPTESRDCRFRSNQGGRDWWAALGACVCVCVCVCVCMCECRPAHSESLQSLQVKGAVKASVCKTCE